MWQKKISGSIIPLVSDLSADCNASVHNFISRALLAEEWNIYANSTNIAKDKNGDFIVKKELIKFLSPYKDIINVPTNTTHFRMIFSFLIKISPKNRIEINELHLSKVIVLLQLFADVNLPVSDRISYINPLESIFSDHRMGRDVLNLLFSYGLNYEIFLHHLNRFCLSRGRDNIDPKILELTDNNDYISVYQTLRDAYIAYQHKNYQAAKELYKTAHEFLSTLKAQSGLSFVISKNYDERDSIAKEYYEICHQLDVEQNIQQENISAGWLCRSYTKKPTVYEDIVNSSHSLLSPSSKSCKNK